MNALRTQFYHPATAIDAALESIERGIRRAEGVALVVGPPGTGKSLLLLKVTENVRDDFDVALLSGARICTRRALWQSVLAAIGEPYRGIGEAELRMAVVERIRCLAAAGSGLVLLVDEAHTLPTRLLEELRLLTNVPTPLPAVHIVLAGSPKLEESLGLPRMESLAQRIAVRAYLEPLDHAETMAYLRTQMRAAGLDWDRLFAAGCDDAVFAATDGIPRLVNQLCDHVLVAGDEARPVTPADIAAAWAEIQRLPVSPAIEQAGRSDAERFAAHVSPVASQHVDAADDGYGVIEFGGLDEGTPLEPAAHDPFVGPDVELVFEGADDPFEEFFQHEERVVERYVVRGPDDFSGHLPVASQEGFALGRLLAAFDRDPDPADDQPLAAVGTHRQPAPVEPLAAAVGEVGDTAGRAAADSFSDDDADMVVIEEDLEEPDAERPTVFAVRPGDYRSLFSRLRRGDTDR